ncbi:MAG: BMC domain-containing protein [Clostridia bacterium]|nr:BMC domain-containing protein [Clostridia bacterium]MBR1677481.1 BMC domain-containing protein [Clostridia bacterium]
MSKAIGMIEYKTVSSGITATDMMVKTSDVDIIEAQTVCPGKYISIITGELSAVRAAVDNAKNTFDMQLIDSFVLGNPDESIFPAIIGTTSVEDINALGVIETFDAAQIIVAADNAVKTSEVKLIEIRVARGMCGKSYCMLTGEVAAVQAAIDRAKDVIMPSGMLLDSTVIARPDKKLIDKIL